MVRQQNSTSNRHTGKILIALVVILVVGWALWFFSTYHRVNYGTMYAPIGKANQPFFASKIMLEQVGKSVDVVAGANAFQTLGKVWQNTQEADDTMVLIKQMSPSDNIYMDEMLAWVKSGGHLVVFSQEDYAQDEDLEDYKENQNPVLVALDIQVQSNREQEYSLDDHDKLKRLNNKTLLRLPDESLVVMDREFLSRVVVKTDLPIYHDYTPFLSPSIRELESAFGGVERDTLKALEEALQSPNPLNMPNTGVADLKVGDGRVTVLTASYLFDNPRPRIVAKEDGESSVMGNRTWLVLNDQDNAGSYYSNLAQADHAYFLDYLARDSDKIYLVSNPKNENILQLMWKNTQGLVWAIVVTCLLGLLALPRQFGRIQVLKNTQSRDLLVFFSSIGQYLWATDYAKDLVNSNRRQLFARICAVYPQLANQRYEEVCEILAKKTNLDESLIYKALYEQHNQNQNDFLEITQAFAQLNQHFS